jgi:predicted DNA-binding helix-hairpin-helix protein
MDNLVVLVILLSTLLVTRYVVAMCCFCIDRIEEEERTPINQRELVTV